MHGIFDLKNNVNKFERFCWLAWDIVYRQVIVMPTIHQNNTQFKQAYSKIIKNWLENVKTIRENIYKDGNLDLMIIFREETWKGYILELQLSYNYYPLQAIKTLSAYSNKSWKAALEEFFKVHKVQKNELMIDVFFKKSSWNKCSFPISFCLRFFSRDICIWAFSIKWLN